ncbi:MAG: hypothetical protein R2712_22945 [Vicinamibacterales bacterium]
MELLAGILDRRPEVGLACAEMSGFDDHGWFDPYHLQAYHRSAFADGRHAYRRIFDVGMALADLGPLPASLTGHDPAAGRRRVHVGHVFDTYLLDLVLCQNTVMLRREVVEAVGERRVGVKHWQEVDYL